MYDIIYKFWFKLKYIFLTNISVYLKVNVYLNIMKYTFYVNNIDNFKT